MNTTDNRNISITIYQQYNRVSQAEAINNITECVTHRAGLQELEVLILHQNASKGYFKIIICKSTVHSCVNECK